MSTNNICEYSEQLKNMTKFLLLSIEKDKNILISDVYDFWKEWISLPIKCTMK